MYISPEATWAGNLSAVRVLSTPTQGGQGRFIPGLSETPVGRQLCLPPYHQLEPPVRTCCLHQPGALLRSTSHFCSFLSPKLDGNKVVLRSMCVGSRHSFSFLGRQSPLGSCMSSALPKQSCRQPEPGPPFSLSACLCSCQLATLAQQLWWSS